MTCLYRHFDKEGALLYVGVSLSAVQRLSQHRDGSHWFAEIATVKIEPFKDRKEALAAEREAILKENPRHNLKRPSVKEVRTAEDVQADKSRADLVRRLVQFNPMYSAAEAARALGVGDSAIKRLWDTGELGYVRLPSNPARRYATGWQLIEFLEAATELATHNPTHKLVPDYHGRSRTIVDEKVGVSA
jgi:predicted GIY-YIG superfamily endonuclease